MRRILIVVLLVAGAIVSTRAGQPPIETRLEGFAAYMKQALQDWNVPGIGVAMRLEEMQEAIAEMNKRLKSN